MLDYARRLQRKKNEEEECRKLETEHKMKNEVHKALHTYQQIRF